MKKKELKTRHNEIEKVYILNKDGDVEVEVLFESSQLIFDPYPSCRYMDKHMSLGIDEGIDYLSRLMSRKKYDLKWREWGTNV